MLSVLMSPATSRERFEEVFRSIAETKLDQQQLSPSEPRMMIDFFAGVAGDAYDLIQLNPSLRTTTSPQSRNTPSVRCPPTSGDSSTQVSPKSKGSPDLKRDATGSQKTATESNDLDISSQKPQSAGAQQSQPQANSPLQPNTIANAGSPEQQKPTDLPVAVDVNITGSETTYDLISQPIRDSSYSELCKSHENPAVHPEVTTTSPHSTGAQYELSTKQEECIFQAQAISSFDLMTPAICPQQLLDTAATMTTTNVAETENTWTGDSDSARSLYTCDNCNDSQFVFNVETRRTERCVYCNYPINKEITVK